MPIGFPLTITLPTSGQVQWDSPLNEILRTLIDAVEAPVTADGIDLQSALDFQGQLAINVAGLKLSVGTDDGSSRQFFFKSDGELYVRDGSARSIQLTSSGSLNISLNGGIGGDYIGSSAQVVYSTAGTVFTFTSAPGIYATMEHGDVKIHNGSSAPYVDVKASPVQAVTYNLTLPSAVPAAVSVVTMDTTGSLATSRDLSLMTVTASVGANLGPTTTSQLTASYLLPNRASLPSAGGGLRLVTLDPTGSIGMMPASMSLSMSIDVAHGQPGGSPSYSGDAWQLNDSNDYVDVALDYQHGDTITEVALGTSNSRVTASLWHRAPGTRAQILHKSFNSPGSIGYRVLEPGATTMTGTLPYTPPGSGTLYVRCQLAVGDILGAYYALKVGIQRPRK